MAPVVIKQLFRRLDIAPLVFFRIVVGGLITIELAGEWFTGYSADFFSGHFNIPYQFTPWLKPWPPFWMHLHFALNVVFGVLVTIGLFYRFSAFMLFLGIGSAFLMEQSVYINHTYLYCLIALLMVFVPAHKAWSADVARGAVQAQATAPAWSVYILRFQMGVVYFFAGLAKLNPDWLAGTPMNIWLPARAHYYLIGHLLAQSWLPQFMSWSGAFMDLLVVPALLWKRTRPYAFALICLFHITNVSIFGIGTFPWLSIAMTALFLSPAAFRQLGILRKKLPSLQEVAKEQASSIKPGKVTLALLAIYCFLQLAIPLRQFAYAGNTSYTESGHNFSWHMMLRDKRGYVTFKVVDKTKKLNETVSLNKHLSSRQQQRMVGKPEMILAFAHYLKNYYQKQGYTNVEVYGGGMVSFNGRPHQPFIDPTVDLGNESFSLGEYHWILPLKNHE